MGVYETLFRFAEVTHKYMGDPTTHPWAQGFPLTTQVPGGPPLPDSIAITAQDRMYPKADGQPPLREATLPSDLTAYRVINGEGDRLPGVVIGYSSGKEQPFRPLPPHLVVQTAQGFEPPENRAISEVRVALPSVRRIVWQRRGRTPYQPGTAILRTCMFDASGQGIEILDFAPRFFHRDRVFRPAQLVRRVRPLFHHDPSRPPVDPVVLVAFSCVAPIQHIDGAVGAVVEVDAAEPGVGGEGHVGFMAGDVAAAFALEPIDVDAAAVEVEGEELAAVFGGPVVAEIDARAAVGVAAAESVVAGAGASLPAVIRQAAALGLGGLEPLVGIPATVE